MKARLTCNMAGIWHYTPTYSLGTCNPERIDYISRQAMTKNYYKQRIIIRKERVKNGHSMSQIMINKDFYSSVQTSLNILFKKFLSSPL